MSVVIREPDRWCLVSAAGAEELLAPMDFSFVDLAESMFCFCLPRQGAWISILFHHSLSFCVSVCACVLVCLYFLLTFPSSGCP